MWFRNEHLTGAPVWQSIRTLQIQGFWHEQKGALAPTWAAPASGGLQFFFCCCFVVNEFQEYSTSPLPPEQNFHLQIVMVKQVLLIAIILTFLITC